MPQVQDLRDFCEQRARKGEGAFAIACALLTLAEAQGATAAAIQRLGNGNASTHFGALESLGMQVEKAAQIVAEAMPSFNPTA